MMSMKRAALTGLGAWVFGMCLGAVMPDAAKSAAHRSMVCPPTTPSETQPRPCATGSTLGTHFAASRDSSPGIKASAVAGAVPVPQLDPLQFFQQLVDRYRGLASYRDRSTLVQVTQRDGAAASRVETSIVCEITRGELKVTTPADQVRQSLKLDLPVRKSQPTREAQSQFDLWLAPHMTLKYADEPLKKMRAGVDEGFTATEAEPVTIDDKPMVHIELKSGDGLSEYCTATVDLYVNPESMLIERIDSEQRLPDGANYSTRLDITPEHAEGEPAASPHALPESSPAASPAPQAAPAQPAVL